VIDCTGYRAKNSFSGLKRFKFERREAGEGEVEIAVLFCGVCHSDIHQAKNEWSNTNYPCVPGHEIVGRISKIGIGVERFKVGDTVGVGCIIDSCRKCDLAWQAKKTTARVPTVTSAPTTDLSCPRVKAKGVRINTLTKIHLVDIQM